MVSFSAHSLEVYLTNCTFRGYDTGVVLDGCTGTIENCTFEDMNYQAIELRNIGATVGFTVKDCEIVNNGGAGIYLYNSSPEISGCTIENNGCAVAGGAIWTYNSSPTLKDNDIRENLYAGLKSKGGGSVFMTNYADTFRNRFADNNTITHYPRADSSWSELVVFGPSMLVMDVGHNDVINDAGDYLISSSGISGLMATYNYWQTPGGLDLGDFYPYGSVWYNPPDLFPNRIDDGGDEAAYAQFRRAVEARAGGNYGEAYRVFVSIIEEYPESNSAPAALRQVYECGPAGGVSIADLQRYFAGVAGRDGGSLGIFADRLATFRAEDDVLVDGIIGVAHAIVLFQ
jgi:parallel beta-helix repeat protein